MALSPNRGLDLAMNVAGSGVLLGLLLVLSIPGYGSEVVHLRSGFDLEAQSHVLDGSTCLLRTKTGTIELPQEDVEAIDALPDAPSPAETPVRPALTSLSTLIESVAATQASTPEFVRFVRSVAQVESAMRQSARSAKGAAGIMQLMPGTAKELGVFAADTGENIRGGAKYLKELLIRYHNDSVLALAAYNAGPGTVRKYGGVPPYFETRRYIGLVLAEYVRLQTAQGR